MHQMRISTNQVSSVVLRPKKLEIRKIVKTVKEPKKPNTVPWNWAKLLTLFIVDWSELLTNCSVIIVKIPNNDQS
jgi:hypothetical protein